MSSLNRALTGGTSQGLGYSAHPRGLRDGGAISNRSIRSQQRAGRFRSNCSTRSLHTLHKSTRKFLQKKQPTFEELRDSVITAQKTPKQQQSDNLQSKATDLLRARKQEEIKVQEHIKELSKDSVGWVPPEKPDDVVRLLFENRNSLGIFTSMWKVTKINSLISQFQADGIFSNEDQVNWSMVDHQKRLSELIAVGKIKNCVAAHNVHESIERSQAGGTSAMVLNRLASFVIESGSDPSGLGRWSWIRVGFGGYSTYLVSAYQPCRPASARRRRRKWTSRKSKTILKKSTVWHQQRRYFLRKGEFQCPRKLWQRDLVEQLVEWRSADSNVFLMADLNEDIYSGKFARRLQEDDLLMLELCQSFHGLQAPASHIRGTKAIVGLFKSPGIVCKNYLICEHGRGVGDHRLHVADLCGYSVLGTPYPTIGAAESRKLTCKCPRSVAKYNRVLKDLALRHRLFDKTVGLDSHADAVCSGNMTPSEFQLLMSKWDKQLTDYMLSAEDQSNKFYNGPLPYSPEVGIWVRRKRLYTQMESFHNREMTDPRNFLRACKKALIDPPSSISPEQRVLLLQASTQKLQDLRKDAPKLRRTHLNDRLHDARLRGDQKAINAIIALLKNEGVRKTWRNIHKTTNPRTSGAVGAIQENVPSNPRTFHDQDNLFDQASSQLVERFSLAYSAPIFQQQLFDDVGYCGDLPATIAILRGEYQFPPDTDFYTKTMCQRAAHIFSTMSAHETATFVTTDDFVFYWKTQDERVKSSPSRLHMGHYCAASRDRNNASLHAWKLSVCARTGVPLERWGFGIQVLLEKIFGAVLIEDMRAITLFEADANWWTKLVFARRMMENASRQNTLPQEQFARKGRQTTDASLVLTLFADLSRIMHHPASICGCDLGQAYDRVAHCIQSIACQAYGVPGKAVAMWLLIMQTMAFYLSTAYGLSKQTYGGSPQHRTMGDGQGSGFAPPAFNCLSALMIEGYKTMDHGLRLVTAWSGVLLWLAAIIFVDDTDLLHWAPTPSLAVPEFTRYIQTAINDWGRFVQATGGILKRKKCHIYLMMYKFRRGIAKLRTPKELGDPTFTIPQPVGPDVSIPLLHCSKASKGLGVFSCPAGDFTTHVDERIVSKGLSWADKLAIRPLPRTDAWISLKSQLVPSMTYGIGVVSHPLEKLEEAYGRVYYRLLPFLGMNRNIRKEFRTLPKKYHGVGLPNMNIECVCAKLDLLLRHWDSPDAVGSMLTAAFEALQVETGIPGQLLSQPFDRFGFLATKAWFSHLWELLSTFDITITMDNRFELPLFREHDLAIIPAIIATGLFSDSVVLSINRVRKFLHVYALSDLVLMDGKSLDTSIFEKKPLESRWHFSFEKPTPSDFNNWEIAIRSLFSSTLTLHQPLGRFLHQPHQAMDWRFSSDRDEVYYIVGEGQWVAYRRAPSTYVLRGRIPYVMDRQESIWSSTLDFASVSLVDGSTVHLHSTASPPPPINVDLSFWGIIHSFSNKSLFKTFTCVGDGSWIMTAIQNKTLLICSDGSYMPMVDRRISSAAFIIKCSATGNCAKGTVVDKSPSAGNYRGEILGSYMAALVIFAATHGSVMSDALPVEFGCDNTGVNSHGNSLYASLPAKQSQADILRAYKNVRVALQVSSSNTYVASHLDKVVQWCHLTPLQQLNCLCDAMAKDALVEAVATDDFIEDSFPFESIHISVDKVKSCGRLKERVYDLWGSRVARRVLHDKNILHKNLFNLVDWEALAAVGTSHGPAFSAWLTKHVTHCCGTNRHLSRMDKSVKNICPSCSLPDETVQHILRCRDEKRTQMFEHSCTELDSWLIKTRTSPSLRSTLLAFIRGRGRVTMLSCTPPVSRLRALASSQDKLGWDSLMEGRVSTLFYQHRLEDCAARQRKGSARKWANQLVAQILRITHAQWCFRNQCIHHKVDGELTCRDVEELIRQVGELAHTDPMDLLEDHRDLLDIDFDHLLQSDSIADLNYWVAEMTAAKEAAIHGRRLELAARRIQPQRRVTRSVSNGGHTSQSSAPSHRFSPYRLRSVVRSENDPVVVGEKELQYKPRVKYK